MPRSAQRIWGALGITDEMTWDSALESFPPNHAFAAAQIIFPRADAAKFARANPPIMNTTPTETIPAPVAAPEPTEKNETGTNLITIDDFAKVELRVGKVVEAERVPKADKLLRLQVDVGTETRQVLAGIAQFYAPEEIVGKTVIVVANLAPRTLRGYESRGMLLAASAGDQLSLVTTLGEMQAGAQVR
jgi:methionyl-tRNA synthetase